MREECALNILSRDHNPSLVQKDASHVRKGAHLAYQIAVARGNMYRFLSTAYLRPPARDLVRKLVDERFLEELSSLFGEEMVAGLREFAGSVNPDKDLASLKQEYMDLFAVPTGRSVTPFEDVYRGKRPDQQEKGPLMGERAIAVRRAYREAGAKMNPACKELPTHIGVEISFMSFLCGREAAALANGEGNASLSQKETRVTDPIRFRELQVRFLQEHLIPWFPQLSRLIQANAKTQFYPSLALITEDFLARDMASLFGAILFEENK